MKCTLWSLWRSRSHVRGPSPVAGARRDLWRSPVSRWWGKKNKTFPVRFWSVTRRRRRRGGEIKLSGKQTEWGFIPFFLFITAQLQQLSLLCCCYEQPQLPWQLQAPSYSTVGSTRKAENVKETVILGNKWRPGRTVGSLTRQQSTVWVHERFNSTEADLWSKDERRKQFVFYHWGLFVFSPSGHSCDHHGKILFSAPEDEYHQGWFNIYLQQIWEKKPNEQKKSAAYLRKMSPQNKYISQNSHTHSVFLLHYKNLFKETINLMGKMQNSQSNSVRCLIERPFSFISNAKKNALNKK